MPMNRFPTPFPPPFASAWGDDVYGLWADLALPGTKESKAIRQRFRWIEPGEFLMGSPENELGRNMYEVQHLVTLTKGFWLADTTVTQALWLSVMGSESFSLFTGDQENPVEQVGCYDADSFIEKLNSLIFGLTAILPSEAQWEYACRAGSVTPFSFGIDATQDQVNFGDGKNEKKSIYRNKTVPVKFFPPNPWGLYEMHGNVWEWCQDAWLGNLGFDPVTDPLNNLEKRYINRVLRGGSWYTSVSSSRSASRRYDSPNVLYPFFGFRLAIR